MIPRLCARPVNSSVIRAWRLRHATGRRVQPRGMPQPRGGLTRDSTRPDWSMPVIDNLSHDAVLSRRVNPGVRHASTSVAGWLLVYLGTLQRTFDIRIA